jgi:uncharacterized protein (DUF58 family)
MFITPQIMSPKFFYHRILNMFKVRTPSIPEQTGIELGRKSIYIMPSRYGIGFIVILLIMLFGAINYNNNLGYLLTFLLTSLGLVSILHTYRNLSGLNIRAIKTTAVFMGEHADFKLRIDNPSALTRYALLFQPATAPNFWSAQPVGASSVVTDAPKHTHCIISLKVLAEERGYFSLKKIIVFTRFPLGFFHAWAILHLDTKVLVYPAPIGRDAFPQHISAQLQTGQYVGNGDDFVGYRSYQLGDSPKHIAWKAVAREQGTFVKQFGGAKSQQVYFTWEMVSHLASIEVALSQLTLWIVLADKQGLSYGLTLPHLQIPCAQGAAHRQYCLQTLALFGK